MTLVDKFTEPADPADPTGTPVASSMPTKSAGLGFAAAIGPVASATIIHTDSQGLDAGALTIPVDSFAMPAYQTRPQGATALPVVLVISEIFGLHEHIADIARRFARRGYLAIAPDLFARQGDAGAYRDTDKLVAEVVEKTPDAQVLRDLDATLAWAGAHDGDLSRLGATGFCWGGRVTWLLAAHDSRVRAGVAWYGKLRPPVTPQKPLRPVDVAARLKAPVLGLYGGQDQSIPQHDVQAMRAALEPGSEAARASRIVMYPDAGHAFAADYRPSYRPEDARDGWERCLEWFSSHGVKP
jgi:carboxymethylenebutenolidase